MLQTILTKRFDPIPPVSVPVVAPIMGLFSVGCSKGQPTKLNRSDYSLMLNEDVRLLQFMLHPSPPSLIWSGL